MKKRFFLIITLVLLFCITGCKDNDPDTHNHTLEKKDAVSATCNSHGNIEYYVCNSCNKLFKDKDGNIEITSEELIISNLVCKDEDHDYYCDYNCGKVFLLKEEVQTIIDNSLNQTEVTVKEKYIPGASERLYYFDADFMYKYKEYPLEEQYFYKQDEKVYNISTYIDEWKLEEYNEEISFKVIDVLKQMFNLNVTSDISIGQCVYGYFEGKRIINFKNELGLRVALIVEENSTIMEGFLICDENNNYTHEIILEFEKNEEILTVFENIKKQLTSYKYDEVINTYYVYSSEGLTEVVDLAKLSGTSENPATIKLMIDIDAKGIAGNYGEFEYTILIDTGFINLDLNGFTLYTSDDVYALIQVGSYWGSYSDAVLTINDSSIEKTGKIYSKTVGINNYGGTLIVNNGTIEINCETDSFTCAINSMAGKITINDGNFIVKSVSYTFLSCCIDDGGSYGILTIKGGNFSVEAPHAINLYIRGEAFIDGGTFYSTYLNFEVTGKVYLGTNEEGIGAKFIDGIKSYNPLNELLTSETAFYEINNVRITLNDTQTELINHGDITIKKK